MPARTARHETYGGTGGTARNVQRLDTYICRAAAPMRAGARVWSSGSTATTLRVPRPQGQSENRAKSANFAVCHRHLGVPTPTPTPTPTSTCHCEKRLRRSNPPRRRALPVRRAPGNDTQRHATRCFRSASQSADPQRTKPCAPSRPASCARQHHAGPDGKQTQRDGPQDVAPGPQQFSGEQQLQALQAERGKRGEAAAEFPPSRTRGDRAARQRTRWRRSRRRTNRSGTSPAR